MKLEQCCGECVDESFLTPNSKEVAATENGIVLEVIYVTPLESLKFLNRAALNKPASETLKCLVHSKLKKLRLY